MSGALGLHVDGTPESCTEAAEWLKKFDVGAAEAAVYASTAIGAANRTWWGPASARFQELTKDTRNVCDDLALTCRNAATALENFGGALTKVKERMDSIRDKAIAAGLKTNRISVLPPDKAKIITSAKPELPPAPDSSAMRDYNEAVGAYNAQVADYNTKREVFNECSTMLKEVRISETEAHTELEGALPRSAAPASAEGGGSGLADWKVGGITMISAFDAAATAGTSASRYEAIAQAKKLDESADMFRQFATATRWDTTLSPAHRRLLTQLSNTAGFGADRYRELIDLYSKVLPEEQRPQEKWVAVDSAARRVHGGRIRAGHTAPGQPVRFFGRAITATKIISILEEENQLATAGQQTRQGAVVKAVGRVSGDLFGAFVGGAVGSVGGPVGAFGAALGAGELGSFAGGWIVEQAMPRDFDIQYNQPWIEEGPEDYATR
ncbi:hypothetical protein CFN78_00120 [Amycolatopsis antarctica]|uniref:Uncharacterized protein n=1 Tax=Amycolatopsis antarctica TaxID=1854586 RepID=A0A263D8C3_9PSEU|nr:hypothetical protein [Amycolatopsis antarctica]OZM74693.1 hypothetical protein CFN78_00120 [Amycolatopsis antarctica]